MLYRVIRDLWALLLEMIYRVIRELLTLLLEMIYRVIRDLLTLLLEMISQVFVIKKFRTNMCRILDSYGVVAD